MTTASLQTVTEVALADAADRTGLARPALRVVRAEYVTWRDGSLGCPEKGMVYTDALVPGYRIEIRAGDRVLDYHASAGGHLILCPAERAVEPLPSDAV